MADRTAIASGNWSNPATWQSGIIPVDGDNVILQGFLVTLDVDINQPNTIINTNSSGGVQYNGTATRNVIVKQVGNGSHLSTAGLIRNTSSGTLNLYCELLVGGSVNSAHGAVNSSIGTFNIFGTSRGGLAANNGAANTGTGVMWVDVAEASNFGDGAWSGTNPAGRLSVGEAIGPSSEAAGNFGGVFGGAANVTLVGKITSGPTGRMGVRGSCFQLPGVNNQFRGRLENGDVVLLVDQNSLADYPAEVDVRLGVPYGFDIYEGLAAIPDPAQVSLGVPVGASVGLAYLSGADVAIAVENGLEANTTALEGVQEAIVDFDTTQGQTNTALDAINETLIEVTDALVGALVDYDTIAHTVGVSPNRTLTVPVIGPSPNVSFNDISVIRGDSFLVTLEGIAFDEFFSKAYFTVKTDRQMGDAWAIIQIQELEGLIVLNAQPVTDPDQQEWGALRLYHDIANNPPEEPPTIEIEFKPELTYALKVADNYHYDIQVQRTSGEVETLVMGRFIVLPDVTKRIN